MHFCNRSAAGGRNGFCVSHLFYLGVATLGAPGRRNKTNGERRCDKIAWSSGIMCSICFRRCFAYFLYWHIELVDALVDVVCSAVLMTYGLTHVLTGVLITRFKYQFFVSSTLHFK